jgi:hypothetical protein
LNGGAGFNGKALKIKVKIFSFKIWKLGKEIRPLQTEKDRSPF